MDGKESAAASSGLQNKEYPVEQFSPDTIVFEVEMFSIRGNEQRVDIFPGMGDSVSFTQFREQGTNSKEIKDKEGNFIKWPAGSSGSADTKLFKITGKKSWLNHAIKIEAKRNYVAHKYSDGKRSWYQEREEKEKPGKWPDQVHLEYLELTWPTEEMLFHIYLYSKDKEAEFHKKKMEETTSILNKILILDKGEDVEYVVERVVSF